MGGPDTLPVPHRPAQHPTRPDAARGAGPSQMGWLRTVANGSELVRSTAMSALNQLSLALSCALGEATDQLQKGDGRLEARPCGSQGAPGCERGRGRASSEIKRLAACATFLTSELRELEVGRPMMGRRYGELLSSTIRQQLRTVVDNCAERAAALLRQLPRGRGLGYLGNVNSAAKARRSSPFVTPPPTARLLVLPASSALLVGGARCCRVPCTRWTTTRPSRKSRSWPRCCCPRCRSAMRERRCDTHVALTTASRPGHTARAPLRAAVPRALHSSPSPHAQLCALT